MTVRSMAIAEEYYRRGWINRRLYVAASSYAADLASAEHRVNGKPVPDAGLAAAERLERADLSVPEKLRPLLHAVAREDLAPSDWAENNGVASRYGIHLLRLALSSILVVYDPD